MIEFFMPMIPPETSLKPVDKFEGLYSISKNGAIYSHLSNKYLKPYKSNDGYLRVNLSKNGKVKIKMVHRLVAETFLPNPDNLPVVNHMDGNKSNPDICNLEWVSVAENAVHAFDTGLHIISEKHRKSASKVAAANGAKTTSKKIVQLNKDGVVVSNFESVRSAERITGVPRQNIIRVCKKGCGTAGGFSWRYLDE